jgi:hypothetical protein
MFFCSEEGGTRSVTNVGNDLLNGITAQKTITLTKIINTSQDDTLQKTLTPQEKAAHRNVTSGVLKQISFNENGKH